MARRPSRPVQEPENPSEEQAQSESEATSQNESESTSLDDADEQSIPEPDESPALTEEQLDEIAAADKAEAVARATESAKKFLKALAAYSDDTPDTFTIAGTYGKVFKLGDVKAMKPMLEALAEDGDKPEIDEAMKKAAANFNGAIAGYPEGIPLDRPIGGNAGAVITYGDLLALKALFDAILYEDDEEDDDEASAMADQVGGDDA